MSKNNKSFLRKNIGQIVSLVIALSSLAVSCSSLRISENVRDMTIPNGHYYVTVFSNRNVSEAKYPTVNHFSVDIQYYGSVPSEHIIIDLSIVPTVSGRIEVIESDPLINHIRSDIIIVYNCPIAVNLRVVYRVIDTASQRVTFKVSNVYSDCPVRVRHDQEEPYIIQPRQFVQPF